ncbi:GNAT family N-acetyltransferase [Nocardiopsis algeriensis]|uniref:RimJ/RimL family protein N-acetyltransferase n=1 Tax=Nocardiopsis algeriensis TaxID=1478215 RepID=A0A841IP32_9ACTN|nr:GNAT family N-acetyltransferase [Nocardiopsis algeriensis]MBB6119842.1 RimJ/RimL family protein N-acetyltransferase [Nocardiopsis algeriensis]
MSLELQTDRLLIREWKTDDAEAALRVYGTDEVTSRLTPELRPLSDAEAMRSVLHAWIEAGPNLMPPAGRWAIVRKDDGEVVGGLSLKLLPPYEEDFELTWALSPDVWGQGYATEAGRAIISWAFEQGIEEVFAVARSSNERAVAVARRLGMEWVGETEKYYDTRLQVFRLRPA